MQMWFYLLQLDGKRRHHDECRTTYQHLSKIADAPGEALPDAEIICALHKRWAFMDLILRIAAEIYAEHAALTKGTPIDISGLSYDILKEKRVYNGLIHKGTVNMGAPQDYLLIKNFIHHSEKANIHSFDDENKVNNPILITH